MVRCPSLLSPPLRVSPFRCVVCGPCLCVLEVTSCAANVCSDSSSEDQAYITDNGLTLYCDEKCFDTSTDPADGLWCNMRGLGQLCRACHENK